MYFARIHIIIRRYFVSIVI